MGMRKGGNNWIRMERRWTDWSDEKNEKKVE